VGGSWKKGFRCGQEWKGSRNCCPPNTDSGSTVAGTILILSNRFPMSSEIGAFGHLFFPGPFSYIWGPVPIS
jgi:hypothetical protein